MKITFSEKLIAYLTLLSGLSLSAVAIYYSVIGLTAIFSAAVIPIIVMGIILEVSKLVATIWLKQNWSIAPRTIKIYLSIAITILMLITSMGIFGFLSKSHSDQTLVSGDVLSKIAVYDEKIKVAKDNIDANRKALKQLDEAVDQVMARSSTEQGADKAVQIRRSQAKERARLLQEIQTEQKKISTLNEERAPIAAEVRKVEAEVGPIKYIASFIYGETDKTLLEKAVIWVIIIIVLVFDPLAVILLLASQVSFQKFREIKTTNISTETTTVSTTTITIDNQEFIQKQINDIWLALEQPCSNCGTTMTYTPDIGISCPNKECSTNHVESIEEDNSPEKESNIVSTATVIIDDFDINKHPYLFEKSKLHHPPGIEPVGPQVYKNDDTVQLTTVTPYPQISEPKQEDVNIEKLENLVSSIEDNVKKIYIQNEEQKESNLWTSTSTAIHANLQENIKIKMAREREEKIKSLVIQVKEGRLDLSQVPEDLLNDVKVKV